MIAGLLGWTILGSFTVERYAHRGESLLPWLVRYDRRNPGPRSLALFEWIARSRGFGRPVRRDAAARAALRQLERGELEAAITILRVPDDDTSRPVAVDRSGTFGAMIRCIIGHLVPEASLPLSKVDVFDAPLSDPLRQMLELLELLTRGHTLAALRIWTGLDVEHLHIRNPTLLTLVHGAIVEVDPGERDAFIRRLDQLDPAAAHLVRRRHPELTARDDGYRQAPRPQHLTTVLAVPQTVLAQRRLARPVVGEPPLPLARITTTIGNNLWVSFVLGALVGLPGAALLAILLVSGIGPRTAKWIRKALDGEERVNVFRAAGITAPERLEELRHSTVEPMLVVALHRAERAIEAGQPDEARELIGWWYQGLTAEELRARPIHPVAASALRTAALLGYASVLTQMVSGVLMNSSLRSGSGHGNAEQALRLAQALSLAVRDNYTWASLHIREAADARAVTLDDYELALYSELVQRLEAAGDPVPATLPGLSRMRSATSPSWVETVWPSAS